MKRYGNIYEKIYDYDNLYKAYQKSKRGKGTYREVKEFEKDIKSNLLKLQENLIYQTYKTSEYIVFNIEDRGKQREIYKLPYYPDRIVHWAIMLQIEHVFIETFICDTYAAIPKKGTHIASKRLFSWLKEDPENTKYCLKLDIEKFFPKL